MKKWLFTFLFFISWFIFVFFIKNDFLLTIHVPIKIPNIIFYLCTIISILFTTYSIIKLHEEYSLKETKEYNRYVLVDYVFFQGIFFSFFIIKSIFLSFSCSVITLLASLFLYYESKSFDKNNSKYLWYSIYYNLFISLLLLITYFMNL